MSKAAQLELSEELDWLDPTQEAITKYANQAREMSLNVEGMHRGIKKLPEILRKLGFDKLRSGQDEAVLSLISQKDTYCVMPTGGGKSAIYIVPTLCMDWKTVIFSPLVSLMKDQAMKLRQFGLAGDAVSSGQVAAQNNRAFMNWESNDLQFMLVAPERMDSDKFMDLMRRCPPDMVVVDEAHCISQWGDSFRTPYLRLGNFIGQVKPKVVLSLTATATTEVETDIRTVLGLQKARRVVYYPKRDNLKFETMYNVSDMTLLSRLQRLEGQVIVYCSTRKRCESLQESLKEDITGSSLFYHGGMAQEDRSYVQDAFMSGKVRVMFATNAFGMGVDKPDIRGIFHADISGSLEALVQEQGRAGRDGRDSLCLMCWNQKAMDTAEWLINSSYPERYIIERVYHALQRLQNPAGVIQLTLDDLSKSLGINSKVVASAVGILTGARVLDRTKSDSNPTKFQILRDHPDAQFNRILDVIRQKCGVGETGWHEVTLEKLAYYLEISSTTLMTKVRQLDKGGYLKYTLPFRGKTTKIIGDISMVPFDRVEQRRRAQLEKLDLVQEFVEVPDGRKHDYLQKYFGVKR